ncbi:MAG: CapA family protein, partial [Methanothrix sp.]|nr:CapA family protein [Methanothrix sp.]
RDDFKEKQAPQVVPYLQQADIRYCMVEQLLSDRGSLQVFAGWNFRVPPRCVDTYKISGIDVGSPNGNHALEFGHDAFLDTIDILEKNGVRVIGAGRNIAEARKPAIIERKGLKVAFLAYTSILGPGEAAEANRPGVAPMRVDTHYRLNEYNQPGTPPVIRSIPWREDLEAMKADVKKAKQESDIVIVAFHFGIHYIRALLAEYQFEAAHAAIDAGADLIVGHHPHILKGIEVYNGKVIFYSLGEFMHDRLLKLPGGDTFVQKAMKEATGGNIGITGGQKPATAHGRMIDVNRTGLGKIIVLNKKIERVSFVPWKMSADEHPTPQKMAPGSESFNEVVNYMQDITQEAGLNTQFKLEGDELVIVT